MQTSQLRKARRRDGSHGKAARATYAECCTYYVPASPLACSPAGIPLSVACKPSMDIRPEDSVLGHHLKHDAVAPSPQTSAIIGAGPSVHATAKLCCPDLRKEAPPYRPPPGDTYAAGGRAA